MAIEGILPVIPTPFLGGNFDEASFQRMLDYMLPWVDGYTLLGSTGEAPSLSTLDRMRITEFALRVTPSNKTVVIGVTHTSLNDSIQLAVHAQEHGAAGVLCASPYYFANTAEGLRRYLAAVDRALAIELVLYDNPVSTGTKLQADQVVAYAREMRNLNSVKLTDHDLSKVGVWQQAGLRVLAGDDPILFRYLAAGVDGAIVIAPVLFPEPFRRVWDHVQGGDLVTALTTLGRELLPVLHVFGIGDEIATSKQLLMQMGIFESAEVRPPLEPTDAQRSELLRVALEAVTNAAVR
jgi:4-hydroxy-tetrahydrodipicolinate synthase